MTLTRPLYDRRRTLLITALAVLIVMFLWINPLQLGIVDLVLSPLRLFVTFVHEAGHSLAALLSGGQVIGFTVSADGSGLATTAGGSRALILPAGYLGAALFGSLMFYIVNRFPRYMDAIAFLLGAGMILFTLLFARPDETGSPLAMLLGIGFGGVLVLMGAKANTLVTLLTLNVLALMTALNAVFDVYGDLVQYGDQFNRLGVRTDAAAFSREVVPILSPVLVGVIWSLIAVLIVAAAVYYAIWKPLRAEVNSAYERITRA